MQQHNTLRGMKPGQSLFQPQRVINGFLHEHFNNRLAPGVEHSLTESAAKTRHAREANSLDFHALPIKGNDARFLNNRANFLHVPGFEVVVAQHGHNRNVGIGVEIFGKHLGFLCKAVIGQVAAKQQDIGLV
ncbi:MAG: hypothetical protein JWL90_715 [Chthoniobacteraceae bacterium]|nr:hypothetical protein [Chthoniobacteraceae bacterium]